MPSASRFERFSLEASHVAMTLGLVALVSVLLFPLIRITGLRHGSVVYLIPVVIAATRWGLGSALIGAVCGVLASAFFFYPPVYSLRITNPHEVLNLFLFVFVAVMVSQLATRLRRQLDKARQREIDLGDLYAFSRRLAGAVEVTDIHAAIEEHLATVLQRKVILFESAREASNLTGTRRTGGLVPQPVLDQVADVASGRQADANATVKVTIDGGEIWLVRAVAPRNSEFGVIAVNVGSISSDDYDELRARLDAVLADATATLERLDIAHAIGEARMRAQTDQLREALIESVSHELRTPLASILGAATVLGSAPALQNEPKLKMLVQDVHDEAERLNNDIQNLLDASRISSEGVKPRIEWADPTDIINSAIERCRRRLAGRQVTVVLDSDLPLIRVDAVLVQQALVQIFDNASKYSHPGSKIALTASAHEGALTISVRDEGAGLTQAERAHMWGRFVRGERHAAVTSGSGLGLWIANAFIAANGGSIIAVSEGPDRGTTIKIELPITQAAVSQLESDEKDE